MFATCRLALFCLLLPGLFIAGCNSGPETKTTPMPVPGARPGVPRNVIRPALDKSPMDMIYFPKDYPILRMSGKTNEPPIARIIYSRPEKDGRVIFGNVVRYREPWRLGANEATEIEFFRDVNILGKPVKKGRYILYCVPYPDKWTLILNSDLFVWGLHIHGDRDLMSFDVPVTTSTDVYEVFTMQFDATPTGAVLTMAWDNVKASIPITL